MTEQPMRVEVNCTTGEEKLVPLTEEEIEFALKIQADSEAIEAERKAAEEAKAQAKASALAKLAALGLTEEEANAIAG
jgi:hypothetical protein